jgi:hypothetical protein
LDKELDTLDRGSGSLGNGGGDTTHCEEIVSVVPRFTQVCHLLSPAAAELRSSQQQDNAIDGGCERTQEVDNETGHAHEGLVLLDDCSDTC